MSEENQTADAGNENQPPPEGWIQIPVLRGVYEIEPLLNLCDTIGGRIIGGYARFCCSPRENPDRAGDVDIFPVGASSEDCERIYESWKTALASAGLVAKHENNVSITYEKPEKPPFNRCPTIQLIKPVSEGAILTMGSVEDVLGNFDFTIVRVSLNSDRRTATAWASFNDDEQSRRLRILNIHCPISSLLRVMKYARKGYYMRPIEAMKLFADWENRTPEYRNRMADLFLTGTMGKLEKKEVDELEKLLRVD